MLRGLILVSLLIGIAVVVLPFLASSAYIDTRGVIIPGQVFSKSETVTVLHNEWQRLTDVTIEYERPDGRGVGFAKTLLDQPRYDALHLHQAVSLHYLRDEDLPSLPLVKSLRRAELLPRVRLADQKILSGLRARMTLSDLATIVVFAGALLLLLLWNVTHWSVIKWIAGASAVLVLLLMLVSAFPTPTPEPRVEVVEGIARVKSIGRIDRLFAGKHERGTAASQPIQVLGLEFVPATRIEPVVAVDLINAGSVPGLRENASVPIVYERGSPRIAHIQKAQRDFLSRNVIGTAIWLVASAAVVVVLLGIGKAFGVLYRRLIAR